VDEAFYRGEMTQDDVFQRISERRVGCEEGFKSNLIIYPVLRYIQRILGHTIYARGESIIRVTHEDLQLIDTMIMSDHELQRPDLILCMVRHWLGLRTNSRSTGIITMESYVTYIGHRLGTQLGEEDTCRISPVMDDKAIYVSHFIRISRRLTGREAIDSLIHLLQGRSDVAAGALADVPHRRPSTPPTNAMMEDIPSSSMQPAPGSSRLTASHPTHNPYMWDIL
jgi:ATHILA ORF-1 family